MQLTYRGNTYEMTTSIQFAAIVKKNTNIKLTYRGQQYDYTPPVELPDTTASQLVMLTYRGNTYQCKRPAVKCTQQSRVIQLTVAARYS